MFNNNVNRIVHSFYMNRCLLSIRLIDHINHLRPFYEKRDFFEKFYCHNCGEYKYNSLSKIGMIRFRNVICFACKQCLYKINGRRTPSMNDRSNSDVHYYKKRNNKISVFCLNLKTI